MKTRLVNFWDALRASYWFVPSLMSLGAIALSFGSLRLDRALGPDGSRAVGWLWAGGADGARSILSTIASSMITVAGVVFSITIVALTLASSQFGPRLLRNFVRDSINQTVLGTFVATYLYCLLVLREVKSLDGDLFVPHLSITIGVVLTTASLGMLIFFIHHVAISIQAENVVASVAAELRASIASLFPEKAGEDAGDPAAGRELDQRFDAGPTVAVAAARGGYIQAIELETVMALAKGGDIRIRLLARPGDFVLEGGALAEILPANDAARDRVAQISAAHIIEPSRTPRQDAEYCVNQLVEIAVRALSPGINDPFTAIACVHWLGDAIRLAAGRHMPDRYRLDDEKHLRVIARVTTFAGITDAAFNAIRQYGASSPVVAIRLLDTFAAITPHLTRIEDHAALRRHVEMTARDALASSPDADDAAEIERRLRHALAGLAATE